MRLIPIGVIRTPFKQAAGTPIQPVFSQGARGTVELFPEFVKGLADLEGFERIWLIYWFDKTAPARLCVKPFLDQQERGIFATRAPCRPNPIGISCVRLLKVSGSLLDIGDMDILDGTPLLDIKPYMSKFDAYEVEQCGWFGNATMGQTIADQRFNI